MTLNTTKVPNWIRIIDFDDELLLLVSSVLTHMPPNHHLSNGKTYVVRPHRVQVAGVESALVASFAGTGIFGLQDVVDCGRLELEDYGVADICGRRGGGVFVAFFANNDGVCGCCGGGGGGRG